MAGPLANEGDGVMMKMSFAKLARGNKVVRGAMFVRTAMFVRGAMLAAAVAGGLTLAACNGGMGGGAGGAAVAPSGLELVPLTISMGSTTHAFTVEVARSEDEQATGLMNRSSLAANAGMIFPFDQPKYAAFWMKNTLIPLDMLFVRRDGSIDRIAENTVPLSLEPVASGGEVASVLELPGGTAARLGIDETAIVRWQAVAR